MYVCCFMFNVALAALWQTINANVPPRSFVVPFEVTPFPLRLISPRVKVPFGDEIPVAVRRVLTQPVLLPGAAANPGVSVKCGAVMMEVRVRKNFLGVGSVASELKLGSHCRSNVVDRERGDLLFVYPLRGCETRRLVLPGKVIYKNVLHYVPRKNLGIIRRSHSVAIPIECFYYKFHHVYKLVAHPVFKTAIVAKALESQLGFQLKLINSTWIDSRKKEYQIGQIVQLQAIINLDDKKKKLYVKYCFATMSPNHRSKPQYVLVDNYGCLMDSKFGSGQSRFVPPRKYNMIRMDVKAFQFNRKPNSEIYIHCSMVLTDNHPPTEMTKSCSYNQVTQRWEELEGLDEVCQCCDSTCGERFHSSNPEPGVVASSTVTALLVAGNNNEEASGLV
uniref:Zona pellucida sperm-binding protein 3 n=1 Tax=Erpetoichthys calabaricus TaxID=27687 RepID=A0A8C4SF36_ERPCA